MTIDDPPPITTASTLAATTEAATVMASCINRLPEFWPDESEVWFARIEALFSIHGITRDETKFDYVLAHASQDLVPYITSVIKEELPEGTSKYAKIKERVTQAFSTSEESKLRKLFKGQMLGDKKPSQFLTIMRNAASGQCNTTVLKSLFMEHMPESVRTILSVSQVTDLDNLALIADKIVENQSPAFIGAVNTTKDNTVSELQAAVKSLTDKVDKLLISNKNRSRSKSRNNSNYQNNQNSEKSGKSNLCFYHERFGINARKCVPPCQWINPAPEN